MTVPAPPQQPWAPQQQWAPAPYAGPTFQPAPPPEVRYDQAAKRNAAAVFFAMLGVSLALIAWSVLHDPNAGFRAPASLGGEERLDQFFVDDDIPGVLSFGESAADEQLSASYGALLPRYVLSAVKRPGTAMTFFDDLNSMAGVHVIEPRIIGSVACSDAGYPVCSWGTDRTVGAVTSLADISLEQLARVAEEARDSVES